jgi:hypothetical protein
MENLLSLTKISQIMNFQKISASAARLLGRFCMSVLALYQKLYVNQQSILKIFFLFFKHICQSETLQYGGGQRSFTQIYSFPACCWWSSWTDTCPRAVFVWVYWIISQSKMIPLRLCNYWYYFYPLTSEWMTWWPNNVQKCSLHLWGLIQEVSSDILQSKDPSWNDVTRLM